MADVLVSVAGGAVKRLRDMGDGTCAEVVYSANGGGGGGGAGSDREFVTTTYRCKTAFTGAGVGDTITATQVIDVTDTPVTVATLWRNQTAAADLSGAPSAANLELVGAQALTAAQLAVAGLATDAVLQTVRDRLPSALLTPGLLPVDTLATPGVPRVQALTAAASSIVLTATCRRVSMYATQGAWYSLSGAASASSHYIAAGERLDFNVPAGTTLSLLRETVDGSIRITELA